MTAWKPITGTQYQVSDDGQIYSLHLGGCLRQHPDPKGYLQVRIRIDGVKRTVRVHNLVADAFLGPKPEGSQVRHLDDDKTNNRADNLAWGTQSENNYDAVRNGKHHQANKTECIHGHPLTADNVRVIKTGGRRCLTCERGYEVARQPRSRSRR